MNINDMRLRLYNTKENIRVRIDDLTRAMRDIDIVLSQLDLETKKSWILTSEEAYRAVKENNLVKLTKHFMAKFDVGMRVAKHVADQYMDLCE